VTYLAFGPVFGTASKDSPYDARGLEALAEACRAAAPLPLVAIGGIDLEGARRVGSAGARGAAVISAVTCADDPVQATRALARALAGGRNEAGG
jgi:thiamine-phosphate diphosphorylase